ncbi:GIY-YIG nuclease family protein [Micromonospora sp. NPDC047738]|uniref:GIY-YIG nuclease family protein n=1 Tax=Micromonospora sp. NPDC047738 TaxID=3155741 RepID=UPI0033C8AB62
MTTRPVKDELRVWQKWGFGMAPVKPAAHQERKSAAATVLALLDAVELERATAALDQVAVVKGLYSRCYRQDQWDWFTVWQQLGRPDFAHSRRAAGALASVRTATKKQDAAALKAALDDFAGAGGRQHLAAFPAERTPERPGTGYIYILSTREQPTVLKIGFTDRSVEERVKEINRATGVMIPFGVRALWAVRGARAVEGALHALLADYRVRPDREFFQLDLRTARALIEQHLASASTGTPHW